MNENVIKVLVCEVGKTPVLKEIEDTLENWQKLVKGYIEVVAPYDFNEKRYPWPNVDIVLNEEGKITGLPGNRVIMGPNDSPYDVLMGNIAFVGVDDEGCFRSLEDSEIEGILNCPEFNNPLIRSDNFEIR